MFKAILSATLVIIFSACGGNGDDRKDGFSEVEKNPEDSLFQEVMDGHDEAMAKMNKIRGYRKEFAGKLDSLKKIRSEAKEKLSKAYEEASLELKEAEEEMNTWMQEFSIDSAADDMERRLKYLKSEKIKVNKVKEDIFSALEKADSLLKK